MAKQPKIKTSIIITAMIVIGIMQLGAMYFGVNGTFRAICVGLIAGLAGIVMPVPKVFTSK